MKSFLNDYASGVIRTPELLYQIGVSRSTVWRWEKSRPDFNKRIKLGERSVGWLRSEVNDWLASRDRVDRTTKTEGGRHE
ncbi:AlpA family phage regulatory protein [bacterium]|nr:AlpA family phage regulatory protein [bacterium]